MRQARRFPLRQMTPAGLSQLHNLATTYHSRPSRYLGLTGSDPVALYWQWAIDLACALCAQHEEERRRAEDEQAEKGQQIQRALGVGA